MKAHNITNYFFPITDISRFFSSGYQEPASYNFINNFKSRVNEAISNLKAEARFKLNEVGFITSSVFYKYAKHEFPKLNWILAEQIYWGGTITSSELLTFMDIREAIRSAKKYKAYVMSKGMLMETAGKQDLHRKTPEQFKREINAELYFF